MIRGKECFRCEIVVTRKARADKFLLDMSVLKMNSNRYKSKWLRL